MIHVLLAQPRDIAARQDVVERELIAVAMIQDDSIGHQNDADEPRNETLAKEHHQERPKEID